MKKYIETRYKYFSFCAVSKYWQLLIVLLCLPLILVAQNPDLPKDEELSFLNISTKVKDFTLDLAGNIYIISSQNDFVKLDKKGKEVFRYSNNTFGELSYASVENPLQILLYYTDFQTIITLDRTLNETGRMDLTTLLLSQDLLVCMSNDNNIYVFDKIEQKLIKVNRSLKTLYESNDLRLRDGAIFYPNYMLQNAYQSYLNDPQKGIYVFSNFDKLVAEVPIKGIDFFQVGKRDELIYQKEKELFLYGFRKKESEDLYTSPKEETHKMVFNKGKVYLLADGQLWTQIIDNQPPKHKK